jgi:hypothetical protein
MNESTPYRLVVTIEDQAAMNGEVMAIERVIKQIRGVADVGHGEFATAAKLCVDRVTKAINELGEELAGKRQGGR